MNVVTKIAIQRRKDLGGAQGFRRRLGYRRRGSCVWEGGGYAVVCLSVTMRTSLGSFALSPRNFRWWSGMVSGTFISGTSPIRQGLAEKRAGNLNFIGGTAM